MEFFISTLFIRTPNKFQNIKHFSVVLMSFIDIKWMKDKFGIFISIFCKNYLIKSIISSIFGWIFLHFKDLVNEVYIFFINTLLIRTSWWTSKYLDLWDSQDNFTI